MQPTNAAKLLLGCLGLICLGSILVVSLFALGMRLSYSTRKRLDQAWVEAAQQLGLAYTSQTLDEIVREDRTEYPAPTGIRRFIRVSSAPPPQLPGMAGSYQGLPVSIDTHSPMTGPGLEGTGDRYTRLTATISNPRDVRFETRTKRAPSPYANLQAEHCESGVEAFDRRFYTRCDPVDFVSRSIPSLAPWFSAISGQVEVRIEDQTLVVSMMGLVTDIATIRAALDLAVELDRALGS